MPVQTACLLSFLYLLLHTKISATDRPLRASLFTPIRPPQPCILVYRYTGGRCLLAACVALVMCTAGCQLFFIFLKVLLFLCVSAARCPSTCKHTHICTSHKHSPTHLTYTHIQLCVVSMYTHTHTHTHTQTYSTRLFLRL